jgi:hypothetical protein
MTSGSERPHGNLLDAALELLNESGRGGTIRITGESMQPMLRAGDLVAIEFSPEPLARGDLILFRQGDSLLLHRLLGPARAKGDGVSRLRTRGDGARTLDPPLDPADVVARVVAFDDGVHWRTTRSARARRYARSVAWHGLGWAGLAWVFRAGDRALGSLGVPAFLGPLVGSIDRWLLRVVHRVLFSRAHAEIPKPDEAGGGNASDRLL